MLKQLGLCEKTTDDFINETVDLALGIGSCSMSALCFFENDDVWLSAYRGVELQTSCFTLANSEYSLFSMKKGGIFRDELSINSPHLKSPFIANGAKFFAAVPIHFNEEVIGALAVYDQVARKILPSEKRRLESLAKLIMEYVGKCRTIADLRVTQEALQASEIKFRGFINAASDAFIGTDNTGNVISWNASAHKIFGVPEWEMLGKNFSLIFSESTRQVLIQELMSKSAHGEAKVFETSGVDQLGREFPLEVAGSYWTADGKKFYTFLARDISARRRVADEGQAENRLALESRETRLRTLTESIPLIIWTSKSDGAELYFNARWYEYTGCPYGEVNAEIWKSFIHPEDYGAVLDVYYRCKRERRNFESRYRLRNKEGLYRWHLGRNVMIADTNGSEVSTVGFSTDIHDQVESQEAVRALQQRTESAIQNAPILLWAVDMDGCFTFYDGKVSHALGVKPADRIGKNILAEYTGRDEIAGNVRRALAGETVIGESQIGDVYLENKFSPQYDCWLTHYGMTELIVSEVIAMTPSQVESA